MDRVPTTFDGFSRIVSFLLNEHNTGESIIDIPKIDTWYTPFEIPGMMNIFIVMRKYKMLGRIWISVPIVIEVRFYVSAKNQISYLYLNRVFPKLIGRLGTNINFHKRVLNLTCLDMLRRQHWLPPQACATDLTVQLRLPKAGHIDLSTGIWMKNNKIESSIIKMY